MLPMDTNEGLQSEQVGRIEPPGVSRRLQLVRSRSCHGNTFDTESGGARITPGSPGCSNANHAMLVVVALANRMARIVWAC